MYKLKKLIGIIKSSPKALLFHPKIISLILIILVVFGLSSFYVVILKDLPNPQGLKNYKVIPVSSEIMDRNGKLLYDIFDKENRIPIRIKDLPEYVKQATIAIEDKEFYKHGGISLVGGMIRALKDTIILRKGLQGGSTITQQLVKSALLSPERTVTRKIKEVILALWTEQILKKDEILELYLNQVPYGGSAYGIEQASRIYFNKSAKALTLPQAALLAGLPRAPSRYSPYSDPEVAKRRRNDVLAEMAKLKFITNEQKDNAIREDLEIETFKTKINAPHFVFYVRSILEKEYGASIVEEGGLKVTTSLDLDLQKQAEATLSAELEKIKKLNVGNGAALVTRPTTGEILAMIGSRDYFSSPSGTFNVTTALRQPGSSIKPINYAIGIDRKLVTPASVFLDVKSCFTAPGQPKAYCPVNYDGNYHGLVQLRFALGNSYNIPAVKMLQLNGVENFVASSSSFLFTSFKDPTRYGLSLTLGGGEVTMVDMAQAFSSFANEGIPKKLVAVLKVEDKNGNVLYEYKDNNLVKNIREPINYPNYLNITGNRAISRDTAFIISHILLDNNARSAAFGARSQLNIPKHVAVSVKTGTTNDLRDNWTIGYTPNFLVAIWVGNNDNKPMSRVVSGVTGAAPIWNGIMSFVIKDQPDLWPRKPDSVVGRQVCSDSGLLMARSPEGVESCHSRFEYFIKGFESVSSSVKSTKEFIPVSKDTGKMTTVEDPSHEMQEKTVIKDGISTYCVDCVNDFGPSPTLTPTP
ncbi:hypothetical protein A3C23_05580 [Candidatus Roizmanbacteria bacterium RIFCSPHIGHO2_02_FULL_37_13b]|uniref:Uncharacterized protein n=1 Tax=Candidatus Roizmanbacteria bacterium RIFCSPLOWO2_02_FULL_36_11 TaxID=1802071 RepID=A0A1F7JCE3_9BACT|nr:MAG: hypothetical protein A3C23_05580 [Candidatus Roizmanbacteria bacterium RIFCSPHIGHO2_02_FULL_37_13b]OGK53288.1 MAG: hypothetical protein A3H78_03210 [Candidatus Roizmanbacteria bacterium RIFCSPLOWO2_02_FULL_36_11]